MMRRLLQWIRANPIIFAMAVIQVLFAIWIVRYIDDRTDELHVQIERNKRNIEEIMLRLNLP